MRPLVFEDDLSRLIDQAKPSMLFEGSTPDELEEWQHAFRDKLIDLLGLQPERGSLDLEFLEEEDCGAYVRHRVQYQSEVDVLAPAYLLVPKGIDDPVPGMLCIHGHSHFGKEGVAGRNHTSELQAEIDRYHFDFGHRFAGQGCVVLVPELRGFGERRPDYPNPKTDYCARNYMCATLLGTTVVALHLCDLATSLDVLESLDYVDNDKLACAGLSLGGRMTMMISAMDPRIKVAVPSGCMNLFQERYQALSQCGAQLIPGLLRYGDTPEIFSLIAPRPMVIEIGEQDKLIPHEWAERGLARIDKAYEAAGALDNLHIERFDNGHIFSGKVASEVMQKTWRQ